MSLDTNSLFTTEGNPRYETVCHISEGTSSYRYLGLISLLNYFNKSKKFVCSPISSNINESHITWNSNKNNLIKSNLFEEKLTVCVKNNESRYIVITLILQADINSIRHINYILIDKGIKLNSPIAVRIESRGIGKTLDKYNPDFLDNELSNFLLKYGCAYLNQNDVDVMPQGPTILEVIERGDKEQLIKNSGLCISHSFVILYLIFNLLNGTDLNDVDITNEKIDTTMEGKTLFKEIFSSIYSYFRWPGEDVIERWSEGHAIALNSIITKNNNAMLQQIIELYNINRPNTRKISIYTTKYIKNMTQSLGIEDNDSNKLSILNILNNFTPEIKEKMVTIFGIDFEYIYKNYFPNPNNNPNKSSKHRYAPYGGMKTKKKNISSKKTKRKNISPKKNKRK